MLRGKDVHEIEELKRQGLSIRAISRLTGCDRKTIRKYLIQPEAAPVYGPRPAQASRLDPFKPYLEERLNAGVWNAQVLLREPRMRGYPGGYTIVKEWLHPQRESGAGGGGAAIRDAAVDSSNAHPVDMVAGGPAYRAAFHRIGSECYPSSATINLEVWRFNSKPASSKRGAPTWRTPWSWTCPRVAAPKKRP